LCYARRWLAPQARRRAPAAPVPAPERVRLPTEESARHRPERLAASPALDVFLAQIYTREQWALRRVAGPVSSGAERYECPARAGKVRCPLVERSMAQPVTLPKVLGPPEPSAHRCCSATTRLCPRRGRLQVPATALLGQPHVDQLVQQALPGRGLVREPQGPFSRSPRTWRLPRHGPMQELAHARDLRRCHEPAPARHLDGEDRPERATFPR
jgi:hypothetical protein